MGNNDSIQIVDIEKELSKLWQAKTNKDDMQACLFNWIVYTQDPQRTDYFKGLVRLLIEKFNIRIIFIQVDPKKNESYLHVNVSIEGGEEFETLGSDFILIETSMDYIERIPYLILSHFIPDVPIYLLWGENPIAENQILSSFQKLATRLIFDSETCDDLQLFSQKMLEFLNQSRIDVVDLNWSRIHSWRKIFANAFESETSFKNLEETTSIIIHYNNRSSDLFLHSETQALYFQAWLASSMSWKFEKMVKNNSTIVIYYKTKLQTVIIQLESHLHQKILCEEILSIEVTNEKDFFYTLTRKDEKQVIFHCSTKYLCELPSTYYLLSIQNAKNFMQEIIFRSCDRKYHDMLLILSQIKWK